MTARGWAAGGAARAVTWLLCVVGPAWTQYDPAVDDVDSLRATDAIYVGNQVCRDCHGAAYETWLGTAHARSWVFLGTARADSIAARMAQGPVRSPQRSARCLTCHGTAAQVADADRADDFHLADGVQCEGCHGPGGMHTTKGLFLAGPRLMASLMEIPDEGACRRCHKVPASHDLLGRPPFDYDRARKQIAHPTPPQEAQRLRRERPGAWASLSLRNLLGRWFR